MSAETAERERRIAEFRAEMHERCLDVDEWCANDHARCLELSRWVMGFGPKPTFDTEVVTDHDRALLAPYTGAP